MICEKGGKLTYAVFVKDGEGIINAEHNCPNSTSPAFKKRSMNKTNIYSQIYFAVDDPQFAYSEINQIKHLSKLHN